MIRARVLFRTAGVIGAAALAAGQAGVADGQTPMACPPGGEEVSRPSLPGAQHLTPSRVAGPHTSRVRDRVQEPGSACTISGNLLSPQACTQAVAFGSRLSRARDPALAGKGGSCKQDRRTA